jgi:hypothetical protein
MKNLMYPLEYEAALLTVRDHGLTKEIADQTLSESSRVITLPIALAVIARHGLQERYEDLLREKVKQYPALSEIVRNDPGLITRDLPWAQTKP